MKEIGSRIWHEPSVAIGLLISIALTVVTIINGTDFDWNTILLVLGPLLTGLGIRPTVTPVATVEDDKKAEAVAKLRP